MALCPLYSSLNPPPPQQQNTKHITSSESLHPIPCKAIQFAPGRCSLQDRCPVGNDCAARPHEPTLGFDVVDSTSYIPSTSRSQELYTITSESEDSIDPTTARTTTSTYRPQLRHHPSLTCPPLHLLLASDRLRPSTLRDQAPSGRVVGE